jgi:hypothetical protein
LYKKGVIKMDKNLLKTIFTYVNRKICRICINGITATNDDIIALLQAVYENDIRIKGLLENYDDIEDKFELDIITW